MIGEHKIQTWCEIEIGVVVVGVAVVAVVVEDDPSRGQTSSTKEASLCGRIGALL